MRRPLLLLALLFIAGCTRTSSQGFVNLGHVGAFSGTDSQADEQASRGMRLALTDKEVAQVDSKPIQIRHTDTRGMIEAYESQAVRLSALSKVAAIYGGDTAPEVASLDRSRGLILSPLGYRPSGVSDQVFYVGLNPSFQGSTLAKFSVDRLAYLSFFSLTPEPLASLMAEPFRPTAVVLTDNRSDESEQASRAFVETWNDAWRKRGEKAPSPNVLTFGKDAAWEDLAGKIAEARPMCVVFAGSAGDFKSLLPHISAPLTMFAGRDGSLRDVPEGRTVYQASAFAADATQPAIADFVKKHREAYKREPDVNAALAYETVRMLSSVLKKSLASGNSPAYELRNLKDAPGLAGKLSFGPGQVIQRSVFVVRQEGNASAMSWRRDPE